MSPSVPSFSIPRAGAGKCELSGVEIEDQGAETRDVWRGVGSILTPLNRKVRD